MKVDERSPVVAAMMEKARIGYSLMAGTRGMREAGTRYLPKFPAESQEHYDARLKLSWLFNGYRKTVNDMTGRIFEKPITYGDDIPQPVLEMLQNVDLQGNDLSVFAREIAEDAISGSGVSYILVDAPPRDGVVSRAEAQAQNLRPYMVHVKLSDILGWRTATVANVQVLAQVRIMESVTEPDGAFGEVEIPQVRVIDRTDAGVTVTLWRKVKAANEREVWQVYQEPFLTGLSEITLVPVYMRRSGFMAGDPVLDDLADVNVAHWQSQSDQRNILHVARVPILFGAGIPEDRPIEISVSSATVTSEPSAKLEWVEHSGQAIGSGRQDLKDLEFQMEAFGLQLLVSKPQQSATGETLDAKKETSQLSMMADALQDALEQALYFMCDYAGVPRQGSLMVNKDFTVAAMSAQELTALLSAVNTGTLSRETFIRELVRRNVIAEVDPMDEAERIEAEGGGADGITG